MELPKLGQQCSHKDCKQLDFLPFQCKCGKIFCSEHFNLHCQECETVIDVQVTELNRFQSYKCSRHDCNETSVVPLTCQRCQKHFCIKHRHLTQCEEKDPKTLAEEKEKAEAPVRRFNEAKKEVDKQIEQNLSEAKKKGKNASLVNKVQLMKIKNKAKGLKTIPTTDRVYFNVSHTNSNGIPLFVSKLWSLGRLIDVIADECGMRNENNKSTGKKLRLFKKENSDIVSNDLAKTLEILMKDNVLLDGENLILDYLKDDL